MTDNRASAERTAQVLEWLPRELVLERLVLDMVETAVRLGASSAAVATWQDGLARVIAASVARPNGPQSEPGDRLVADADAVMSLIRGVAASRSSSVVSEATSLSGGTASSELRSYMGLPLLSGDRLVGVLCLCFPQDEWPAALRDQHAFELLASRFAAALDHARLYRESVEENERLRRSAAENDRTQTALKDSEARFRLMADTTPDVIWITELQPERVVYASPSFERIWGKSVSDLYANPHLWIEGIHPEDRERIGAAFMLWIGHGAGEPWQAEFRVLQPSGGVRWIHERGVFISEPGGPPRVSGISTDITDRRVAEAALRESEQRHALAMEAAKDGHWDWIVETDEFYASPRMLEIYGFAPHTRFSGREDFLARFPFHPDDRTRWSEAAAEHFAGKTARFDLELRMLRAGEVRWIHLSGLVSRHPDGSPSRWTGSVSDVTDRHAGEVALRESEKRYALAMEAARDGHWDWIADTDTFYASPRILEMYGLPADAIFAGREDFIRRCPFHPDDRLAWRRASDAYSPDVKPGLKPRSDCSSTARCVGSAPPAW